MKPPPWYGGDSNHRYHGPWGCFQSHLHIWKQAVEDGLQNVLIMEDDCIFCGNFSQRAKVFLQNVPDDWDMIYLGGEHLHTDRIPPIRINEYVIRGRNVNRTHAYVVNRSMMEYLIDKLSKKWPKQRPNNYYNFDYQLGATHEDKNAYCPTQWLCGQKAGHSDVMHGRRFMSTMWWKEFPIVEAATC